jgi:uncharacterized membrane protein YvbJ
MTCKKCGKPMPDTARFCTSCGWKTSEWNEEARKFNNNKNVGIICFVIGLITAALLLLLFFVNI